MPLSSCWSSTTLRRDGVTFLPSSPELTADSTWLKWCSPSYSDHQQEVFWELLIQLQKETDSFWQVSNPAKRWSVGLISVRNSMSNYLWTLIPKSASNFTSRSGLSWTTKRLFVQKKHPHEVNTWNSLSSSSHPSLFCRQVFNYLSSWTM